MITSCAGGAASSPGPLDPSRVDQLALELHKCVKKDQFVKAKMTLKGLKREEKRLIVRKLVDGNAPLFVAANQGQVAFVNYLLDECDADIEQRGVYEVMEDRSRHQVTPLWCAAVANKLEVVKTLIKHGADVNSTSDTQSTPVRSACYMTNIEVKSYPLYYFAMGVFWQVVKYLVENNADIHKPNINGGTCLINSVQSVDLCRFLIDKQANVNAQDNSRNLALHYAIREGRQETVRLLLKHGSDPYMRNDFGDDAIQTACLKGYSEILDYLLAKIKPAVTRQIEAYELMAANFVDEKHDIQRAIQTWRLAMDMRYKDAEKPLLKTQPDVHTRSHAAYQGAREAATHDELEEAAADPDNIYMQALLTRERILGPDHKDTIFGLMYRGAVYADTHHYLRCVDLWKYAFQLRHEKGEPPNHECLFTLQALCKLFWEIHEESLAGFTNENVRFEDVLQVFEMAVDEVRAVWTSRANGVILTAPQLDEFHTLTTLSLHLAHLLGKMAARDCDKMAPFRRLLHELAKLDVRVNRGRHLLHLAVDLETSNVLDEFYSRFPAADVVQALLDVGSDVNGMDEARNTPLHICAEGLQQTVPNCESETLRPIVDLLLERGAHVDARNEPGVVAGDELGKTWYELKLVNHVTLKCLAARAVMRHRLNYRDGAVPCSLLSFIEMH